MAIPASIFHAPDEQHPASTLNRHSRNSGRSGRQLPSPQLLALRTDAGTVYVCPSRWQRLRLQWIFRHFHVLPPQLLSRRDQRLIEKLSQSAAVNPAQPVAGFTLLGVIENVRAKAPAYGNRVVRMRTEAAAKLSVVGRPQQDRPQQDLSPPVQQKEAIGESIDLPAGPKTMRARFTPWGVLAAPAVLGLALMWSGLAGKPQDPKTQVVSKPEFVPAATQTKPPAVHPATPRALMTLPEIAPVPHAEKPKHVPAPEPVSTALAAAPLPVPAATPATASATIPEPAPIVSAAPSALRYVSELPPGHFAHPVVSNPNLVGELQLNALIGADGSVKKVTVLSGSPALAEAGMRAVRQWRYPPYEVEGTPVEVQTRIRMNFFGEDAVSIASVANGSASQPK
jgi:periplasmic protein TonB